ncbi:MAG: PAS domain-containing protein [Geobacteraceae bacterium]
MTPHHTMVNDYMAHGFCFSWEPGLVWLHVVSDIVTGASYYAITFAMFYFAFKRRDLPFYSIFILFATFVVACGTTHFFAAYTIFNPIYWQEGAVKAFTAIISAASALLFIPLLPKAIALPSLNKALEEIEDLNCTLEKQVVDLRESAYRLQLAVASGHLGIWDWDFKSKIFVWDDRMLELHGITRDSFQGDIETWQKRVHPDDLDRSKEEIMAAIKGKKGYDSEYRTVHPNGEIKVIKTEGLVIRDADGSAVRMIGLCRDITEHRLLEEQLRQSQKLESIGRLAGGVAHDFNNILTVIMGYAEISVLQLPEGDPVKKNLQEIVKAANRSREITRQLLAYSRQQVISPKLVDLNALVMETEKTLSRLIGEDIILRFNPGNNLWMVKIDPSQFSQILMNLAINARDAMVRGGNLDITTANTHLDELYFKKYLDVKPGDYVQLTVSDNGDGMDRATLQHIFEPFFTTKEVGKGTGLGLATVYGVVKQNNGFIDVYSEPGHGTTFKLFFPRIAEVCTPESIPNQEIVRSSAIVLLVEDDDAVRQLTAHMLEMTGYTVLLAETPQAALTICEKSDTCIDIILTDVIMPGMSGKAMQEKINAIRPGLKVLFMSGYTSDIIAQRGVLAEGVHFIQKPFNMNTLNAKIQETLFPDGPEDRTTCGK